MLDSSVPAVRPANAATMLARARDYQARGLCVVPLPPKSKIPRIDEWEKLRLSAIELPKHFSDAANIGVHMGEPSSWLIDIDLDHPQAVELAASFLPPTSSTFGRPGKPKSHWLYVTTGPVATYKRQLPKRKAKAAGIKPGMIVELRSTGAQTVFPGSVHPSGERIEWDSDGEPAVVDADELKAAVDALADEVMRRLQVEPAPKPDAPDPTQAYRLAAADQPRNEPPEVRNGKRPSLEERAERWASSAGPAIANQGGDDHTYSVALGLVRGFRLGVDRARPIFQRWNQTCEPPWDEKRLERNLQRAAAAPGVEDGWLADADRPDWRPGRVQSCQQQHDELGSTRPKIDVSHTDLPSLARQAWFALHAANEPEPALFRHAGLPARIEQGDENEPVVRTLGEDRLCHHLARSAEFITWRKTGEEFKEVPTAPPRRLVLDLLATPDMPLPVLSRIVEAPVFAPDGTLQLEPGYHAASRTFYAPAEGFRIPPVPDRPTVEDIGHARELLTVDLLGDFPFVGRRDEHSAELAHALAILLLPFVRDLIKGPTPLHLIEKPTPGTGATLLVDVLALAATGRPVKTMTEGADEDEWRKRVTAKLRGGAIFLLIDNIRRRLDSSAVAAAITSPTWEDRILGMSETISLPVRCVWLATGNNPALSNEMSRRTVRVRLDAKQDRPWLREGFRHPELRTWATENRGGIVWAALTLVRAWLAAGRPKGAVRLGMFESWAETLGGILDVAGVPGFLTNLTDFYDESDAEGAALRAFVSAWWAEHGHREKKGAELFGLAADLDLGLGEGSEQSQKVRLGKLLATMRDRMFDITDGDEQIRVRLERGDLRQNAYRWQLVKVETLGSQNAGECGESGECFPPYLQAPASRACAPVRVREVENTHDTHDTNSPDWPPDDEEFN